MTEAKARLRIQSFIECQNYFDLARLKESLSCQLFLKTDEVWEARKKRALKLDKLDLTRGSAVTRPGNVWLVAPELSGAEETALNVASGLSSRGWKVHLVTRAGEGPTQFRETSDLVIHRIKPLGSYGEAITGRSAVVCFDLSTSASLALKGHKTIFYQVSPDNSYEAGDAVYIPDFIIGKGPAGERRVIPAGADIVERVLMMKTPALPTVPHVPTVSACLIAKDEEGMIEGCLESLVALADETIVNDTGSQDLTVEIAQAYGAAVVRTEWRDDFSRARNDALALAKCSHILTIDADERVLIGTVAGTKGGLLEKNEAWQVEIRNSDNARVRTSHAVRLFRNRLHHRYLGRIHEQIRPSIKGSVGRSPLSLNHLGYAPSIAAVRRKRQRNMGLLIEVTAEGSVLSPAYHKYQAAVETLVAGDYAAATDALTQVLDETGKKTPFRPNAGLHALEGFLAQDRLSEAYSTAVRLVSEYPGFLEAAEMVAEALTEEDPHKAENLLSLATANRSEGDLPVSEGAETYRLDCLRARLALSKGDHDAALSSLRNALNAKPDFAAAQTLLVDNWPGETVRILGELSRGSVRAAVLRCISTGNTTLASDLASSVEDSGAQGEVYLAAADYERAAECFTATNDNWDNMRAAIIVASGLTKRVRTVPEAQSEFVQKILQGRPCDVSELDNVIKALGFLLEIRGVDHFELSLGVLRSYGEEGDVLAARILAERGCLEEAYGHLNKVSDAPDHIALKADIAYRLAKNSDAACYYTALDTIRPLTPNECIRHIDSLVKCGLLRLAKDATVKSLSRYNSNYGLRRVAGILGIAKREV